MTISGESESDPPFHYEIWRGPQAGFVEEPKAIYYVENHNGQCGYNDLAFDFEIATRAILNRYREEDIANWMAPLAHLARQTLELSLKALIESIRGRDATVSSKVLGKHNLLELRMIGIGWLDTNGFKSTIDTRRAGASHLINAYNAIDPSGDLFRFGLSYKRAYGKQKSYDRVGIRLSQFEREFDAARGFLEHWNAVVFRITIGEEMGWKKDPYFDADDFPRDSTTATQDGTENQAISINRE